MIKPGGIKNKYDCAFFYWLNGKKLEGILSSHVGSFLWARTSWVFANVIDHLLMKFEISKEERETLKYLALQIRQSAAKG